MKLLNCLNCHEIFTIYGGDFQYCKCKKSAGRYLKDGNTCEILGPSRVIVILGPEYHTSISDKMAMAGTCFNWFGIIDHDPAVKRVDDRQIIPLNKRYTQASSVHAVQVSSPLHPLINNDRFWEEAQPISLERLAKETKVSEKKISRIRNATIIKGKE